MAGAAALAGSGPTAKAYNIEDLRRMAKRRLPKVIFDYLDGGADDEVTLRNNRSVFSNYDLIARALVDVSGLSTNTTVLGEELSMPVILSSTGANRLFHTDGEMAAARAASAAGTIFATASSAMTSLEDVAAAAPGPNWFQLYVWKDRGVLHEHMRRCKEAGYKTLILTVDCQTSGNRERDFYNHFSFPLRMTPRTILHGLLHPTWSWSYLTSPTFSFPNIEGSVITADSDMSSVVQWFGQQLDCSFTWDDAAKLIESWDGDMIIKGLTSSEDARIAADIGASAVVVSNHGGRQLDHAVSPLEILPEIVDAVGDRLEVLVDSGFRRGTDVIKALALGARAVLIGRPYLYGLAAGGEAGVARALELLQGEIARDMALMGLNSISDISTQCLRKRPLA
ncbi:MAG: alpha-hydroxy acid oxidase [Gammaproteobacteria bacterium]